MKKKKIEEEDGNGGVADIWRKGSHTGESRNEARARMNRGGSLVANVCDSQSAMNRQGLCAAVYTACCTGSRTAHDARERLSLLVWLSAGTPHKVRSGARRLLCPWSVGLHIHTALRVRRSPLSAAVTGQG